MASARRASTARFPQLLGLWTNARSATCCLQIEALYKRPKKVLQAAQVLRANPDGIDRFNRVNLAPNTPPITHVRVLSLPVRLKVPNLHVSFGIKAR